MSLSPEPTLAEALELMLSPMREELVRIGADLEGLFHAFYQAHPEAEDVP